MNHHSHEISKVKKKTKIRNQVPHLTRDTIWQSDKNTRKHLTQESQEVSSFQAGDHKAATNRQDKPYFPQIQDRYHKICRPLQSWNKRSSITIFDQTSRHNLISTHRVFLAVYATCDFQPVQCCYFITYMDLSSV